MVLLCAKGSRKWKRPGVGFGKMGPSEGIGSISEETPDQRGVVNPEDGSEKYGFITFYFI